MTAPARARLLALVEQIRETETTVARKGDVEITVCVLDPIVLKRWADALAALLPPVQPQSMVAKCGDPQEPHDHDREREWSELPIAQRVVSLVSVLCAQGNPDWAHAAVRQVEKELAALLPPVKENEHAANHAANMGWSHDASQIQPEVSDMPNGAGDRHRTIRGDDPLLPQVPKERATDANSTTEGVAALLPPVGQPAKDLQPIIADMQLLSDQADAANGTAEYQTALVSLALAARHYLRELAAEAPVGQPADKAYVDAFRTPFEAFGHNESCGRWVEGPTLINLDRTRPCTCGGVELHPDGPAEAPVGQEGPPPP